MQHDNVTQLAPKVLSGYAHPLVSRVYLKKDFQDRAAREVLVIEADYSRRTDANMSRQDALMELLSGIDILTQHAENKLGPFHSVSIRMH